jgi:hypothetical protein
VTDTTARIIDFNAYRSRRHGRQLDGKPPVSGGASHGFVATGFATPLFWYWPVFVWVPVVVPAASAAGRDFS